MTGQENQQSSRNFSRTSLTVFIFAIFVVIFSTITAIFTQGSWASIVSLLLTAFGAVLGIYQMYLYFTSSEPKTHEASSEQAIILSADDEVYENFRKQIESSLAPGLGAVVVYGKKGLISRKVYIANPSKLVESTKLKLYERVIAERRFNGNLLYVAVFKNIEPGEYHVNISKIMSVVSPITYITAVDVLPGEAYAIDLRFRFINSWV